MTDGADPMPGQPFPRERVSNGRDDLWLSTEDAAREIGGVTARWLRMQVVNGNLPARTLLTGRRVTYRIRGSDLAGFMARFIREPRGQGSDTAWFSLLDDPPVAR